MRDRSSPWPVLATTLLLLGVAACAATQAAPEATPLGIGGFSGGLLAGTRRG